MCHWHFWILQILADVVPIYFCGLDVILGLRIQKFVTLPHVTLVATLSLPDPLPKSTTFSYVKKLFVC